MPDDLFSPLLGDVDVRPLPPAEVRRLGDTRRRRRTALVAGGAALAVALVAVPLSVLGRGGDDSAPPLQTPTSTASSPSDVARDAAGPDAIPADFPLDAALSAAAAGSGASVTGPGPKVAGVRLQVCGQGAWPAGSTSRLALRAIDENALDTRELRVYPTEADAAAVVATLRSVTTSCRTDQTGDGPYTVTPVDASVGYDDVTWLYTDASGRPAGDIVQVVRVGRAVLATRDSSEWTASSGLTGVPQRTQISRVLADRMCGWSSEGCSSAPASTSGPAETASQAQLEAVPIEQGLAAETEGEPLQGPSTTTEGVETAEGTQLGPCGSIWPDTPVSRWAVRATGPEYIDARELRVFATADEAVAAVAHARGAVADCAALGPRGDSGRSVTAVDADTGYDSVTWIASYEQSLGGEIYQVTRVGRAVLATMISGEYEPSTIADQVPDRTALTRSLAPTLCTFTEAGC